MKDFIELCKLSLEIQFFRTCLEKEKNTMRQAKNRMGDISDKEWKILEPQVAQGAIEESTISE
ncbi:hypothetical protein [Candidatus Mesenet endosymbiont of Agriotes lineatus]|uniref:hypothetical protein n=1 Tax=Candidatus Mesenet endosymbiont of Agriotes lineatus TaxID=3077948 RepID=UPI0030D09684